MKKVSFLFFAAILFVLIVPTVNSQLAFYYSFNNQTYTYNKTLATDESGNGYNATLNSTIGNFYYHPNGRSWNGIFLNGSTNSDKFYLGNVSMTSENGSQTSISGWINCSSQADASFISRYDTLNLRSISLRITGTRLSILASNDGSFNVGHRESLNGSIDVCDGSWHHFGVIVNGSQFDLYVDGINDTAVDNVLDDNITYLYTTTVNTSIGYRYTNKNSTAAFTGSLDEIKVWNHALTPSQMLTEYNRIKTIYVSNLGNDNNYGDNSSLPIKTIVQLNLFNLQPKDNVSFNCNSTYYVQNDSYINLQSGSTNGNVTYNSYGNCAGRKPHFYGGYNASLNASWNNGGSGNIWNTTFAVSQDVGNVVFNATDSFYSGVGAKNKTLNYADLDLEHEFYYNATNDILSIYSAAGNPANRSSSVIITTRKSTSDESMFDYSNLNYILLEGLDIRYYGASSIGGIGTTSNQHHIYIINNLISWSGGVFQNSYPDELRYGNGIDISLSAHDINIINNSIWQIYDAGITYQSWTSAGIQVAYNFNITNNIVTFCDRLFEVIDSVTTSTLANMTIIGNTFVYAGYEWRYNNTANGRYARNVMFSTVPYDTYGILIKNNIFKDSLNREYVLGDFSTTKYRGTRPTQDYNLWHNSDGGPGFINYNNTAYANLADFQAGEGQELNSIEIDPVFADGSTLQPTDETACTMSSTGSYVGAVPCNITTQYYLSQSGNDATGDGTASNPYKTITKLNNVTLNPGDIIYFNRGDIWREPLDAYLNLKSGNSSGYITYTAYGTGNLPDIRASRNYSNTGNWTDLGSNKWKSTGTLPTEIGNIILNDSAAARRNTTFANLTRQDDYWYNSTGNHVVFYSVGNPATIHNSVELAEYVTILNIHGRSYLKIENLALLYSSMGAIGNNTAIAHHIIINNTIAKFIGGGYNGGVETDRTGNVYSFSNDAHNVTVINSNLTECWDTAIAVTEWTGSGTQGDFNFSNNIIRRCGFALEFFSTDYLTNNLYFTHNTVVESGWGFSGRGDYIGSYGQGDVRGRSINIKKSKVGSINFVVRDNLIYNSSYVNVNYNESGTWLGERPDLTNNLYWLNGSLLAGYFAVESGNTKTFSQWQTMGFDTDSNEINPLFTTGTFQPTDETACTMSSTGSYVGAVSCDSSGATGCTIPTENMVITTNTTFCSGIYYLSDSDKNGVMTVTANNLNITCNNTQFGGNWVANSTWLKSNTTKGINIQNCNISSYAYGIYAKNISNWNITGFIAKGATNRQLRSIVLLNYTRVIIKNSRFYGGNTSFQPFDMLPEGNRTAAIYSYNGSYLNITNVNVSQFRNGFKLQNANYSNINNTILNNTEDTSISFEDNSCYVTINNSLVENSGWNAYHFEMYSKLQNSIARIGITHGCFDAYSDGDGTTNLYENNLCDRTDRTDSDDCMYLRGVVDTIVRNNTLLGCTNYGINIADAFPNNNITIYNNTIVMGTTEYDHCFGIQSSATTKAKQILIENNSLTCNNKTFNMQANFTTIGQNSWVDNYVYIKLYDTSINFSFNSTVTRLDLNLTSGPNKLNFTGTKPYDFELIYDPYTPIKQIRLKYNGFPFKVTNTSSNTEKYSWDILERNFSFFSSNKFWIQYANATPITYLNLPTNGSLYSITSVVFDCEANAANNISTIKLFIYNATNATIYNATNAVIAPDVKTNFFRDLADGTYSYNCLTNDSVGITRYAAANYTFSVDTSNNIYVGQGVLFNPELSNVTYISPGFYCSNIEVDDWCLNVSGGLYAGYYCHNSSFYANMTLGVTTYVNFFVYDEQTEELINDRDVTILLFSENYTSNYTTGSGTLNISNILVGNYEIRYVADEYHTRAYYTLLPGTLTNTIYLYLINSSVAISSRVTLHITDEYSHNVPNLIVKLQRNYISGNVSVFKTVSMSKTNFEGNAILYVEPYDVWYKLIYETVDGRILKITNPAPFLVDNPSDTVNLGTDSLYSWTVINSVSINLTFINDTGIMYARLVYIDGNNIVRQGCLKLRRLTARGEIPICYNCTVSPSATIACEFDPLLSGQYIATGMIDINSNGSWYSYNEYWNQGGNPNNFGQEGIFGWAVIIGSLALMGIGSFISSFLLVILGLIGAYATGMIVGISSGTIWWVAILGILMLMFLFGKGKGGE